MGFYSHCASNQLVILLEQFENDDVYTDRIKNLLPEYMKDPIDYYRAHNIQPHVIKYVVGLYPIHNGTPLQLSPVLFEEGDDLEVKWSIQKIGHISYNEYMQFLHEAYQSDRLNVDNIYSGNWRMRM